MIRYDHRRAPRVHMRVPAKAFLETRVVSVHDISVNGFGITHDFALNEGETVVLEFRWGKPFVVACIVMRCQPSGMLFRSGLAIKQPPAEYQARVMDVLAQQQARQPTSPFSE